MSTQRRYTTRKRIAPQKWGKRLEFFGAARSEVMAC